MNRPKFIPEEIWDQNLNTSDLGKYFLINRSKPSTYINNLNLYGISIPYVLNENISKKFGLHQRGAKLYNVKELIVFAKSKKAVVEGLVFNEFSYLEVKNKIKKQQDKLDFINSQVARAELEQIALTTLCGMAHVFNKRLPDASDIIGKACEFKPEIGVYFLCNWLEVVYVGQSKNVSSRISSHKNEGKKEFSRYCYIQCEAQHLDLIESIYIHLLRPKYNGRGSEKKLEGYIAAPIGQEQLYEIVTGKIK
jgi:hypothetical protein